MVQRRTDLVRGVRIKNPPRTVSRGLPGTSGVINGEGTRNLGQLSLLKTTRLSVDLPPALISKRCERTPDEQK